MGELLNLLRESWVELSKRLRVGGHGYGEPAANKNTVDGAPVGSSPEQVT